MLTRMSSCVRNIPVMCCRLHECLRSCSVNREVGEGSGRNLNVKKGTSEHSPGQNTFQPNWKGERVVATCIHNYLLTKHVPIDGPVHGRTRKLVQEMPSFPYNISRRPHTAMIRDSISRRKHSITGIWYSATHEGTHTQTIDRHKDHNRVHFWVQASTY